MARALDKELQEFRDIMHPPDRAEDGFGAKTIIGAIFLGLFMLPGSMYMKLFMGATLGPAARWVTVILFAEVARRSLKSLKQQEVFILFYMTGIALATPFQGLLWSQYLVQSDVAMGMGIVGGDKGIPSWAAPPAEIIRESGNTFFTKHWIMPIGLMLFGLIISRVNGFGLGYALYRLTAHGEKLPFPMAPVTAQGVMALTEDKETRTPWRWRAFSIGSVMGMLFGFIYIGIPSITGSVFGTPYKLLPIPWLDLCTKTESVLPATPVNLIFDLSLVILGMVLPFWAVMGGFIGLLFNLIANPLLHKAGYLVSWRPGMGVVDTMYNNSIDFYLSFGIGLTLAIFAVSVGPPLIRGLSAWRKRARDPLARQESSLRDVFAINRLRGDISIWVALGTYCISMIATIVVCTRLVPDFPWIFFVFFGFVYSPIISYVNAKLEGLVGQSVSIPLVREAAYILSGYKGVAIWFAPIPMVDVGRRTREFRVVELTGTRVSSLIKTELVCLPIISIAMILFAQFIWRLGPIPSEAYPFTQQVWRQQALISCLTMTSTAEGGSKFLEALSLSRVTLGMGVGVASFGIMSVLGLPTLLVYGIVRGMGQMTPGAILPEVVGALIGRFYFRRKFGAKEWRRRIPVIMAGFTCGLGLTGMGSIGIALIWKSISTHIY